MALNFPSSPTPGQIFTGPSGSWIWDGTKWAPIGGGGPTFAPPSALVGLTAVNGGAGTAMQSDSAPALSQAITPTWTGQHNFSAAAGALIKGTTTNDNAAAGYVGEYLEAVVPWGTTTSLTSLTGLNVGSPITLTAGDWDVWGMIAFFGASTTAVQTMIASISLSSAVVDSSVPSRNARVCFGSSGNNPFISGQSTISVGPCRFSVSSSTIVYLVAFANFGTSTMQTYGGHIWARRKR